MNAAFDYINQFTEMFLVCIRKGKGSLKLHLKRDGIWAKRERSLV
jgi:hypothetical protein